MESKLSTSNVSSTYVCENSQEYNPFIVSPIFGLPCQSSDFNDPITTIDELDYFVRTIDTSFMDLTPPPTIGEQIEPNSELAIEREKKQVRKIKRPEKGTLEYEKLRLKNKLAAQKHAIKKKSMVEKKEEYYKNLIAENEAFRLQIEKFQEKIRILNQIVVSMQ